MVVAGAIDAVRRTLERRRHLPSRRQPKPHFGRTSELSLFEHEQIRAEELPEVFRGARNGEIDRVGRVIKGDRHAVGPAGDDAPRVFVGAVPPQRLPVRVLGAEAVDVARVVLDLVVAWTPRGQRDHQRVLAGRWKFRADVERPRGQGDFVAYRLRAERRGEQQCEGEAAGETTHHHSGQAVERYLKLERPRRERRGRVPSCRHVASYDETFSLASATIARNSLLGLKTGTGRAATSTGSPVLGLRAIRVLR